MKEEDASLPSISKSRLEFLVDGVFAIALTILVLELKVPELEHRRSISELGRALALESSTFLSYLISFVVLGIFWYRHDQQYRHFQLITRGMLALHLLQLVAAASFPFFAALLGRYPTNELSVVMYLACMLVYSWTSYATWIFAKRSGSMSADLTTAAYLRFRERGFRACLAVSGLFLVFLIAALAS